MPAIDPRFVPLYYLQQVIFNKLDGTLLANGSIIFFEDNNRTVKKPVYKLSLSPSNEYIYTELPNPLTLSSIGGFIDENNAQIILYAFPYEGTPNSSSGSVDLYYVQVYSSDNIFQFDLSAIPNTVVTSQADSQFIGTQNALANPQFTEISFTPDPTTNSYMYSLTGTDTVTPVAPGWEFVSTGVGTVTVKQFSVAELTAEGNPPFALDVNVQGSLSSIVMRQRLYSSPRFLASGFVCGTFLVNSQDSTSHNLRLIYSPSSGSPDTLVNFNTSATSIFETAAGTAQIGGILNGDNAPAGYVDILLELPTIAHVQVTSFQITEVATQHTINIFKEQTVAEQHNGLYYYWEPFLKFKPIKNIMIAWDFKLNPNQFNDSSVVVTTTPQYVWDQTIMSRTGGANVTVTRNSVTGGMSCAATSPTTAFYTLQYLDGKQAKQIIGTYLSANILAWTTTILANQPLVRVYLFRGSSSATFPALPLTIGTMDSSGVFTLTVSNWTEIPRSSQGTAIGTIQNLNSTFSTLNNNLDTQFSGWQITDATQISDTDKFAMVVTYSCPTENTTIVIDSQCLVQGNIPTRPMVQTSNEVLEECQFYFEKSYTQGVNIGTNTQFNSKYSPMMVNPPAFSGITAVMELHALPFSIEFITAKRATNSIVTIYTTGGDINNVSGWIYNAGASLITGSIPITNWTISYEGDKRVDFLATTPGVLLLGPGSPPPAGNSQYAFIIYHYTCDGRIAIV